MVYNGETFTGATGNLTLGEASTFTYLDENGDMQTLEYLAEEGDIISSTTITAPIPGMVAVAEMREAVNGGTAVGTTNSGNIARNSDDIETNRAGIASAIALASLPVLPGGSGNWGIALGSFDSETAVAVGANWNVSDSSNIKVGISSSSGETSAGIGFGMRF